jgi:hypothetical protein
MRLQLAVEFSTEHGDTGGFYMATGWGVDAAAKLRARLENKELKNNVLLEKRNLLKEQGPGLWIELCEFAKAKCLELNANYRSVVIRVKDTVLNEMEVLFEWDGVKADVKINFEPTSSRTALTWVYGGQVSKQTKNGSCPLLIDKDGTVGFQQGITSRTPESLAEEMLNGLIAE